MMMMMMMMVHLQTVAQLLSGSLKCVYHTGVVCFLSVLHGHTHHKAAAEPNTEPHTTEPVPEAGLSTGAVTALIQHPDVDRCSISMRVCVCGGVLS